MWRPHSPIEDKGIPSPSNSITALTQYNIAIIQINSNRKTLSANSNLHIESSMVAQSLSTPLSYDFWPPFVLALRSPPAYPILAPSSSTNIKLSQPGEVQVAYRSLQQVHSRPTQRNPIQVLVFESIISII